MCIFSAHTPYLKIMIYIRYISYGGCVIKQKKLAPKKVILSQKKVMFCIRLKLPITWPTQKFLYLTKKIIITRKTVF